MNSNATTDNNKEECKPLFQAKTEPNNFNFSQFIPTIIAIGVFIYGLLMYDQSKVENETTIIDINTLYILFTIGFFVLFLNNIFNGDKDRKEYYKNKMNDSSIKGISWIHYLLKRFFNYKIKHLDIVIKKIPLLKDSSIKYYEYPFNFSIFIGIIIIVLLDKIFKLNQLLIDDPSTDLKIKAREDKVTKPGHFFCTTNLIGIIGIVFAVFTNKFVLDKTNDETHSQEGRWIARLVFYIVGFVSVVTILGSITYINSEPKAPDPQQKLSGVDIWGITFVSIMGFMAIVIGIYPYIFKKK